MTTDLISVDTGALRATSAALAGAARRLGEGLGGCPGLAAPEAGAGGTPPVSGAAGTALAALGVAVHEWLASLGVRTAATAGAVRTAASDYDAADGRAAGRLTGRG